jgi:hypothetical protein
LKAPRQTPKASAITGKKDLPAINEYVVDPLLIQESQYQAGLANPPRAQDSHNSATQVKLVKLLKLVLKVVKIPLAPLRS